MNKNTAFRTCAVRVTAAFILAAIAVPSSAAAATLQPLPSVSEPAVEAPDIPAPVVAEPSDAQDPPAAATPAEVPEPAETTAPAGPPVPDGEQPPVADVPPVMPDTPKPDPGLLSPEAAQASVDAAAAEGLLGPRSAAPDASAESVRSDPFANQVFNLMNAERRAAGVPALVWNQKIADVSQGWADHLLVATADPKFDWAGIHRPDAGGSMIPAGANWYGEIIAFNFSAASVVDWWMNSPAHRAAMLDPRETHAGVGYVVPTSGPYKGWHLVVSNLAGYPKAKPPAQVSPFSDLRSGQKFLADMNWMYSKRISTGWAEKNGTKTYRPLQAVSREAMAAFMYRLKGSPAYTPPKKSPFKDVKTTHPYYKEIAWLSAQGISKGWSQKNGTKVFRPTAAVSRDAMAAFLYRLKGSPKYTAPKTSPFADVTKSTQFYKEISWLASSGVSTGWPAANGKSEYRPGEIIARDAMAAFMKRWAS
ncbi:uncharacterized protein YkwD [Arthrobacter sp. UYP6]|uniref:CAP and S-layer homology domain-containing protein n=1 Tax=Arthrobacter sp. UYP6 TaxID=1756378 RepID=UPI003393E797